MKLSKLFAWISVLICVVCLAVIPASFAGTEYGPTKFMDDVSVGSWTNVITGINWYTGTNGTFTNGVYTNYYRLCATNRKGRINLSSNVVLTFTGHTNLTNSVTLTWPRYEGIASYVIERSYDAGSTWSNWLTIGASYTNWSDYNTNTWTNSVFTNVHATTIAAPTVPWLTGSDLANASLNAQNLTNETWSIGGTLYATNVHNVYWYGPWSEAVTLVSAWVKTAGSTCAVDVIEQSTNADWNVYETNATMVGVTNGLLNNITNVIEAGNLCGIKINSNTGTNFAWKISGTK